MNSISAVIITRNEARNIQRCLASLKTVADEIIVIDSFSTDETVAICEQAGAIVKQQAWLGFGPQKNLGIQLAQHEYIISLDADEALDEELIASILAVKKQGLQGIFAFSRLNFYFGKFLWHGGQYPDYKVRLFPKSLIQWNEDLVHEDLILPEKLARTRLKGHLLHYTYYTIQEYINKANNYSSLGAKLYQEKGKRASWFKIIFSPVVAFIQAYFIRRGFMDGGHGFIVAMLHAQTTFMKYAKLWQLTKDNTK